MSTRNLSFWWSWWSLLGTGKCETTNTNTAAKCWANKTEGAGFGCARCNKDTVNGQSRPTQHTFTFIHLSINLNLDPDPGKTNKQETKNMSESKPAAEASDLPLAFCRASARNHVEQGKWGFWFCMFVAGAVEYKDFSTSTKLSCIAHYTARSRSESARSAV